MAMVLVGATIVGSMATVWHGIINPPRTGKVEVWDYPEKRLLKQGEELGRFLLGSTIVFLHQHPQIRFNDTWVANKTVNLGEMMATISTV